MSEETKEHPILSKAKITEILKDVEKTKSVEITKLSVKMGPAKGENYSGEVMATNFEATVDGKKKEYHWMVKLPPSDPTRTPMIKAMKMETKEFRVYRELIPAFKKLVKDRKADIELHFAPTPYLEFDEATAADGTKPSILAMENLNFMVRALEVYLQIMTRL